MMEVSVKSKVDRPLLFRSELSGSVSFQGRTPSNDELRKSLASSLKCEESLVVVKRIDSSFGGLSAGFSAFVYKDRDSLAMVEPKKREKKKEEPKEAK